MCSSDLRYKLWLAYGLAISLSALIVIIGLLAIYINGASFSYSFSSILRLSRGAEISVDINKADLDGRDPLPRYLKEATVKFSNVATSPVQSTVMCTPVSEQLEEEGKTTWDICASNVPSGQVLPSDATQPRRVHTT